MKARTPRRIAASTAYWKAQMKLDQRIAFASTVCADSPSNNRRIAELTIECRALYAAWRAA